MEPTHYFDLFWRLACGDDPDGSGRTCIITSPRAPGIVSARLLAPFASPPIPVFVPPVGVIRPTEATAGLEEAVADLARIPLGDLLDRFRGV